MTSLPEDQARPEAAYERRSSRRDALIPALVGLAGVLVGAVTTAGITYLGDRAHRIADERTARRLIASEIRFDTSRLVAVSALGRLPGAGPRTVQWESQASTLARYTTGAQWSAVSGFYDDVLNIEPSLTKPCVSLNTWRFATTVAKEGNAAYEALANESVPSITRLGHAYRCRPSRK